MDKELKIKMNQEMVVALGETECDNGHDSKLIMPTLDSKTGNLYYGKCCDDFGEKVYPILKAIREKYDTMDQQG